SPLVKTAMFASDPNWGRILAAVGRAPVDTLDIQSVSFSINDVQVISNGEPDSGYSEAAGQEAVDPQDIDLSIVIGDGANSTTVWTSDLSHEYVTINAEYRT
ncbi:MAG: bifunctional ornithine acetyltransferase/N-acetylglutamate synthase, partial [bacterium]